MSATSHGPATATTTAQAPEPDLLALLPWCASLLLVIYAVGVAAAVIPLQPTAPAWQLRFCEAVINQSPLVLMGLSLALIAQRATHEAATGACRRILRWTSRMALPLTLGFALLIPLQGAASLQLLRNTNRNAAAMLSNADLNLAAARQAIRQVRSQDELEALANRLPAGLASVGDRGADLAQQQQQLLQALDQLRGRSVLQLQLSSQQQRTQVLRNSLRLSLLAGLLACLFQQARPQRNRRRLTLALPRWSLPRRGRVHAMARYCNDAEGRG
jgi:hypothetical protein